MQPFNLEKALAGAKLVTRDGREVTGFKTRDGVFTEYPYLATVVGLTESTYAADGDHDTDEDNEPTDLFMAEPAKPKTYAPAPWVVKEYKVSSIDAFDMLLEQLAIEGFSLSAVTAEDWPVVKDRPVYARVWSDNDVTMSREMLVKGMCFDRVDFDTVFADKFNTTQMLPGSVELEIQCKECDSFMFAPIAGQANMYDCAKCGHPTVRTPQPTPFDLDRALAGDALVTRSGFAVKDFAPDEVLSDWPYMARVNGLKRRFNIAGLCREGSGELDLFMVCVTMQFKKPPTIDEITELVRESQRTNPVHTQIPEKVEYGGFVPFRKEPAEKPTPVYFNITCKECSCNFFDPIPGHTDMYECHNCGHPTLRKTPKPNILEEANTLIYGDRAAAYGPVSESFSRIGKMWGVILGVEVSPEQVGLCLAAMKICRQVHKPQRDNLIDCAGYVGCIAKIQEEKV